MEPAPKAKPCSRCRERERLSKVSHCRECRNEIANACMRRLRDKRTQPIALAWAGDVAMPLSFLGDVRYGRFELAHATFELVVDGDRAFLRAHRTDAEAERSRAHELLGAVVRRIEGICERQIARASKRKRAA